MQEYKRIEITKDQVVPIAEQMSKKEIFGLFNFKFAS